MAPLDLLPDVSPVHSTGQTPHWVTGPAHTNQNERRAHRKDSQQDVVPPASHRDPLGLAGAGIVLQPAAGGLHSTPINARVEEAVLVEESGRILLWVKPAFWLGIRLQSCCTLERKLPPWHRTGQRVAQPIWQKVSLFTQLCPIIDAGAKDPWASPGHHRAASGHEAVGAVLHAPGSGRTGRSSSHRPPLA